MSKNEVTQLLLEWNRGNAEALDQLMPLISEELRRLARSYFQGESSRHTLQPTALVNEVYLRLVDRRQVNWQDRAHFFAFAARTMRRVLVDHARAHRAAKRGSGARAVTLDERSAQNLPREIDILDLDHALDDLSQLDEKQARVVELRFFAGLTVNETAEVMDIGRATVTRYWTLAKAYLYRRLRRA